MSLAIALSKTDITPDRPCRMGGFNRRDRSTGVLDPIEMNVLAGDVDGVPFVLIVLDSIMVSEEFALAAQARIAERIPVPCANVTVCAVHTHSAPAFFKLAYEDVPAEEDLTAALLDRAVDEACRTWEARREARCTLDSVEIEGLYGNRNVKDGPADKSCRVFTFTGSDGSLLGKLLNISTHPTILSGDNLLLSADLIGQTRRRLERAWGCPVVCTNGTCGDVSTRFYRKGTGVDELMRTADALSDQILRGLRPVSIAPGPEPPVTGEIRMPTVFDAESDPDWIAAKRQVDEAAEDDSPWVRFARRRLELKRRLSPMKLTLINRYLIAGNVVFLTMPCDTCSALGLKMRRAFPGYEVVIIGYANTYCNYLVPEEDYGKYFETMNARTARGQADRFVDRIIGTVRCMIGSSWPSSAGAGPR